MTQTAAFFKSPLSTIRPGETVQFNIHLHFPRKDAMIVLFKTGEMISKRFLEKYQARGIENVWIHKNDAKIFKEYLLSYKNKKNLDLNENHQQSQLELSTLIQSQPQLPQLFNNDQIPAKEKTALIAKLARSTLKESWSSNRLDDQAKTHFMARCAVKDLIENVQIPHSSLITSIWNISETDVELNHSTNVATYSVLIGLSLGKSDRAVLSALAILGLFHEKELLDSLTSAEILNIPTAGIDQILAIADAMDSIASGQWDNIKHTYQDSFQIMLDSIHDGNEKTVHISLQLISAIHRWIQV